MTRSMLTPSCSGWARSAWPSSTRRLSPGSSTETLPKLKLRELRFRLTQPRVVEARDAAACLARSDERAGQVAPTAQADRVWERLACLLKAAPAVASLAGLSPEAQADEAYLEARASVQRQEAPDELR